MTMQAGELWLANMILWLDEMTTARYNAVVVVASHREDSVMPTLILNDVPVPLFDQIHRLAQARQRTPADTVLQVLENALRAAASRLPEGPLPIAPYLTGEITAPFTIPRPDGTLISALQVEPPFPTAHDIPDEE